MPEAKSSKKRYDSMSREELKSLYDVLLKEFEYVKHKDLKLDMSRGKPSSSQLDMMMPIMGMIGPDTDMHASNGVDVRNYGGLEGIPEARRFFADILGVPEDCVIVMGNASLSIMYDTVIEIFAKGLPGCEPLARQKSPKFLCPVPGYDRHFAITGHFGIEMINIPMTEEGPDMDLVEQWVNNDPTVKGIWCVPKYSNPQGYTYSDETVRRFASLKPAAKDFRIYWDNAYAVHDFHENGDVLANIYEECVKTGNQDMVFMFTSTSKITFAGGGISAFAGSRDTVNWFKSFMTLRTIGYDKVNQLRHAKFFEDPQALKDAMARHAAIIEPKFNATLEILDRELEGLGIGTWSRPNGGYFISFDGMKGTARDIVEKCKEAGVTLTNAGATFPYGRDPEDKNIRIAPSYPSPEDMSQAAELFALCVKLVSVGKLLEY